jgi:hypothetical protein
VLLLIVAIVGLKAYKRLRGYDEIDIFTFEPRKHLKKNRSHKENSKSDGDIF